MGASMAGAPILDCGSHWAAHDAPDLLIGDLRQFFRRFRCYRLHGPRDPGVQQRQTGAA
jgi:hypothetical protein